MEKLAAGLRAIWRCSRAQLAIWKLEVGDKKGAMDLPDQAGDDAAEPASGGHQRDAIRLGTGSGSKWPAAPLFARKFREALPVLQAVTARRIPPQTARCGRCWRGRTWRPDADRIRLRDWWAVYPLPLSVRRSTVCFARFPRFLAVRGRAGASRERGRGEEEPRALHEVRGRRGSYEVTGLCSQGLSASP